MKEKQKTLKTDSSIRNYLMSKRGELITIIVVVVASLIIAVTSYIGSFSIDKNIDYVGDSRLNEVYSTSFCLHTIKEIPKTNRVAFGSLPDAIEHGYIYSGECP